MTANLPAPTPSSTVTAPAIEWRSTRGLRTALTWLLAVDAISTLFLVAAHANRVSVIDDIEASSATLGDARSADSFVQRTTWAFIVLFLATAVVWIVWQWRSAKNNDALGKLRLRYRPGWSIGGWFIPFANLVIPVRIFQDLWQGSDPDTTNHRDPHGLPRSRLVGCWWAVYLLAGFIANGSRNAATLDEIREADQRITAASLCFLLAAGLAIVMVRAITERQELARDALQALQAATAASGWYADPTGRFDHRYWNGREWTAHVSRGGEQAVDQPA